MTSEQLDISRLFTKLTITISKDVRGLVDAKPGEPLVYKEIEGIDFLNQKPSNQLSKVFEFANFKSTYKSLDLSDPFNTIIATALAQKEGDAAQAIALFNPEKIDLAKELFAPNVLVETAKLYEKVQSLTFVLAIKQNDTICVWYTLNTKDKQMLQVDILKRFGPIYMLAGESIDASNPIASNITNALIARFNRGIPGLTVE